MSAPLVMRAGQLRARDPLKGLTTGMIAALQEGRGAILAPPRKSAGRLVGGSHIGRALYFAPTAALAALARRRMIRRISRPEAEALYCLTCLGLAAAMESARRAGVRAILERKSA